MSEENSTKTFPFLEAPSAVDGIALDVVNACNLACKTCPRGQRYMKNAIEKMDFNLFKAIINKCSHLGIHYIGLFNFTEPFLCSNLYEYTRYAKSEGHFVSLSSNLSFPHFKNIIESLKTVDRLFVSVSGFNQDTYKINHFGGNISLVKNNLVLIADALSRGIISTEIIIRYFMWDHTKDEYHLFKNFADNIGLNIVKWEGKGNPLVSLPDISERSEEKWLAKHNLESKLVQYNESIERFSDSVCPISIAPINIDHKGDVYLCCTKPFLNSTKIGNFLKDDFDVLQYRRYNHPICAVCNTSWQRVKPLNFHKETLMRGLIKTLQIEHKSFKAACSEIDTASILAGKEVLFYGCGAMFYRKRHVFEKCKPLCIITDTLPKSQYIDGLAVYLADDILPKCKPMPIVIFAGEQAKNKIIESISSKYPQFSEIYSCNNA